MKSAEERMAEFVKYHIEGDGECNNVVLKAWAEKHGLELQDRYVLAFLFSVTYCVESAIALFYARRKEGSLTPKTVAELKPKMIFQSDRKYMRMKDNFEKCVNHFESSNSDAKKFLLNVSDNGKIKLQKAIKYVQSWVMYGRFASFLFLETFIELTGIKSDNTTIDWKNGDTATSGLLNVYGLDNFADAFDKKGILGVSYSNLNTMLGKVLHMIEQNGGNVNVTEVETSLCAYRKFYKGSRYNGYYLDRMLEEINAMKNDFPDISAELLEIRAKSCNIRFLGELGNWCGIRREMKHFYLNEGKINW